MKIRLVFIALLIFHLFLLINTHFTVWPETLLYPYFLNSGLKLYKDIINPYLPLLSFILLFWFKLAGFSLINLKILTWGTIIVADFLIFFVAKKIFKNTKKALLSLVVFIIFQTVYDGNQPWFDLFSTPFLIIYFYFLLKLLSQRKTKYAFFSGTFLGLVFFIKQAAIWLALPFFWLCLKQKKNLIKNLLSFLLPSVIIFSLFSILFISQKIFVDFWFWGFKYTFTIFPKMPGHHLYPSLKQLSLYFPPFVLLIFLATLNIRKTPPHSKKIITLTLVFTLLSLMFCLPRWGVFHLQPAVAFLSLLAPPAIFAFKKKQGFLKIFSSFLFVLFLLNTAILGYRKIILNWHKTERFFDPNTQEIAHWIKENTLETDRIFVFNSEENIYFLSKRLPPQPWAINFPWYLELPGLQERIIQGLKLEKPKYIIFQPFLSGEKFEVGSYQPTLLTEYIFSNYKKVKEFEIAIILGDG